MLVLRVTEDHGAHSSIADRERLTLPVLGRLIVVKGKPLTVCDGGYDKCDEKGADRNFHVLFHCAPFIASGGAYALSLPAGVKMSRCCLIHLNVIFVKR
jgi:hypothetical protein